MKKLFAAVLTATLVTPSAPAHALRQQEAAQTGLEEQLHDALQSPDDLVRATGRLASTVLGLNPNPAVRPEPAVHPEPVEGERPSRRAGLEESSRPKPLSGVMSGQEAFERLKDALLTERISTVAYNNLSVGPMRFRMEMEDIKRALLDGGSDLLTQLLMAATGSDLERQVRLEPVGKVVLVFPTAGLEEDSSLDRLQSFLQREDVTGGGNRQGKAIRGRTLTGIPGQSYDAIVFDQFNLKGLLSDLLRGLDSEGPFTWADVATGPGVAPREAAAKFSNLRPLLVDAKLWTEEQYDPATLAALDRRAKEVGVDDFFSDEFPIHIRDALTADLTSLSTPGFPLRVITMINALAYPPDPLGIVVNLFNQLEPGGMLLTNLYLPTKKQVKDPDGTVREEDYPKADVLARFYGRLQDHLKTLGVEADFRIRDFRDMQPGELNSQGEEGPFKEYAVGIKLVRKEGQQLQLLQPPRDVEEVTLVNAHVRKVTYQVAGYGDDPARVIGLQAAGLEEWRGDLETIKDLSESVAQLISRDYRQRVESGFTQGSPVVPVPDALLSILKRGLDEIRRTASDPSVIPQAENRFRKIWMDYVYIVMGEKGDVETLRAKLDNRRSDLAWNFEQISINMVAKGVLEKFSGSSPPRRILEFRLVPEGARFEHGVSKPTEAVTYAEAADHLAGKMDVVLEGVVRRVAEVIRYPYEISNAGLEESPEPATYDEIVAMQQAELEEPGVSEAIQNEVEGQPNPNGIPMSAVFGFAPNVGVHADIIHLWLRQNSYFMDTSGNSLVWRRKEGVRVIMRDELDPLGVRDADGKLLSSKLGKNIAGIALLPKDLVGGEVVKEKQSSLFLYAHPEIASGIVNMELFPLTMLHTLVSLDADPVFANQRLAEAVADEEEGKTVVIGLDVNYYSRQSGQLNLKRINGVKLLLNPNTMNGLGRYQKQLLAFLRRPGALAGFILDLRSGSVRTVTLDDGRTYYALDIAA